MSGLSNNARNKGDALMKEAKKKLDGFSWFGMNSGKYDSAVDLYCQAGAQYKIAKEWSLAAESYTASAHLNITKLENRGDCANNLSEAARAYKNIHDPRAAELFQQAADILQEDNRFAPAAKLYIEMGEAYLDSLKKTSAIDAFLKASDCYRACNSKVTAESTKIRAADLLALEGELDKAIAIYEEVSSSQAENPAASFSVSTHMFKSLLCCMLKESNKHLADLPATEQMLEKYCALFPRFEGGKEQRLVQDLLTAYVENDSGKFTQHLAKYDSIYKLDQYYSEILFKIKQNLEGSTVVPDIEYGGADLADLQ